MFGWWEGVRRGSLLSRDYASVICYFGKVFNVYMWVMGRVNTVCGRGQGEGGLKIEDG